MSLDKQLIEAAERGDIEEVRSLLDQGADVNAISCYNVIGYYNETPLHKAAAQGYTEIVKFLLEYGANPNTQNRNGETPLYCAVMYGHTEIIELLLKHGANVETKNLVGRTPLREDASNGCQKIVVLLLDKGANIETQNRNGETPLCEAIRYGHAGIAKLLLKHGAESSLSCVLASLREAIMSGHTEIIELLSECRAKNSNGNTFLHYAARNGCKEIVVLLLIYGATLHDGTKRIINNSLSFKNCLTTFKQIKAMPHLGKLIEANIKKEGAEAIAEYINNEAKGQKLIKKFKTIKEKYSSDEQLSFIPEQVLDFVEHITMKFLKFHIDEKTIADQLHRSKDDIQVTKKFTEGVQNIYENLSKIASEKIVSYFDYDTKKNVLLALSKKADVFLSELKNICQNPNTALAEAQLEAAPLQRMGCCCIM